MNVRLIISGAVIFSLIAMPCAFGQKSYPKNYFRSPVDFQIQLSSYFGDIRPNHFHSGIDIRTGGVQGKPVYAVADGYVCRIFISPYGFGKALYITHPNGYTTVYGHLKGFNKAIGSFIRARQYEKESFEMDIPVEPGLLKVKKGEIIAYSGNAGSSGGPHLHFEIRDSPTQDIIDPLLFGLPVTDVVPPKISMVRVYPADDRSMVNFSGAPVSLDVTGSGGSYQPVQKDTVMVSGNIYFGIDVQDFPSGNSVKSGIRTIRLYVDTAEVFSQTLDRFAFAESRYVNALVDYPLLVRKNEEVQRSFICTNNRLSIYHNVKNNGIVNFYDDSRHRVRYEVQDVFGNTSRLTFWVRSHPPAPRREPLPAPEGTFYSCETGHHFTAPGLELDIPADALYEDLYFRYSRVEPNSLCYSPVYQLQDEETPLQKYCTLSIRPVDLPENLRSRALIVQIDSRGRFESQGGEWKDGWVTAHVREFGRYAVRIDTVPPVIRAVNLYPGKNVGRQSSFLVKISDNLSGIRYYRGTLNGRWILMDYDAKNNLLTYDFDDRIRPGKNIFRLVVRDASGNQSVYEAAVTR